LKLTLEEKEFLQKIKAISRKDESTLMDVFISLIHCMTIAVYKEQNEIIIPFLCKLKLEYFDEATSKGTVTKIVLNAEPSEFLKQEISAISEGEDTPSLKYIKKKIFGKFKQYLDLDTEDDE
jgi:hypothetical protein